MGRENGSKQQSHCAVVRGTESIEQSGHFVKISEAE